MSNITTINGNFKLQATLDGTTIYSAFNLSGNPFVQFFKRGADGKPTDFKPNFETMSENEKPTITIIVTNATTGGVEKNIDNVKWKYNTTELEFDVSGLSKAPFAGIFKAFERDTVVSGETYSLPSLRVMKNLVSADNDDNDIISASGHVDVDGHDLPFSGLQQTVEIKEESGFMYSLTIYDDGGSQIDDSDRDIKLTAKLLMNGEPQTDMAGITYKWYLLSSSGNIELKGDGNTVTIDDTQINSSAMVKCDALKGSQKIASAVSAAIVDWTDSYRVRIDMKEKNSNKPIGEHVYPNQIVVITPVAVDKEQNPIVPAVKTWDFAILNNVGEPFTIEGQSQNTFKAEKAEIKYSDIKKAGMGLFGIVSADITLVK